MYYHPIPRVSTAMLLQALIQDVKSQLARVSNTPANRQRLVFRGRVLKDDQLLSSYSARLTDTGTPMRSF